MNNYRIDSMESYIIRNRKVSMEELCKTFSVSINTVRRDLSQLEKRGSIRKIYGGVVSTEPDNNPPLESRILQNTSAKDYIGKLAADLIDDNDCIFIDSGTTAVKIVNYLSSKKGIKLVTHSMSVLEIAVKNTNLTINCVGGQYNPTTRAFFGPETLESLKTLQITKAFIGCSGLTLEGGLANNTYYDPLIKNILLERSKCKILVSDSSKIDTIATRRVCNFNVMDVFVTNERPPEAYIEYCKKYDIKLIY